MIIFKEEVKEKERRKQEREEKRKNKEKATKTKKKRKVTRNTQPTEEANENENDEEITTVVYAGSSDEIEEFGQQNVCGACEGSEEWDEDDKWLGCSKCTRWFHKSCLPREIENMNALELEKLEFHCILCQKRMKK